MTAFGSVISFGASTTRVVVVVVVANSVVVAGGVVVVVSNAVVTGEASVARGSVAAGSVVNTVLGRTLGAMTPTSSTGVDFEHPVAKTIKRPMVPRREPCRVLPMGEALLTKRPQSSLRIDDSLSCQTATILGRDWFPSVSTLRSTGSDVNRTSVCTHRFATSASITSLAPVLPRRSPAFLADSSSTTRMSTERNRRASSARAPFERHRHFRIEDQGYDPAARCSLGFGVRRRWAFRIIDLALSRATSFTAPSTASTSFSSDSSSASLTRLATASAANKVIRVVAMDTV
jgi:hypothetical protein